MSDVEPEGRGVMFIILTWRIPDSRDQEVNPLEIRLGSRHRHSGRCIQVRFIIIRSTKNMPFFPSHFCTSVKTIMC